MKIYSSNLVNQTWCKVDAQESSLLWQFMLLFHDQLLTTQVMYEMKAWAMDVYHLLFKYMRLLKIFYDFFVS